MRDDRSAKRPVGLLTAPSPDLVIAVVSNSILAGPARIVAGVATRTSAHDDDGVVRTVVFDDEAVTVYLVSGEKPAADHRTSRFALRPANELGPRPARFVAF